jgi:hypothetical protein
MKPEEWAVWFREKFPEEPIEELVEALRSAAKFGFWHQSQYAELVIKHLELMD